MKEVLLDFKLYRRGEEGRDWGEEKEIMQV